MPDNNFAGDPRLDPFGAPSVLWRIIWLLAALSFVLLLLFHSHLTSHLNSAVHVVTNMQSIREQSLRASLEMFATQLKDQTRDYAIWDQMFDYVNNHDPQWAEDNLTWLETDQRIEGVAVLDIAGRPIFQSGSFVIWDIPLQARVFQTAQERLRDQIQMSTYVAADEGLYWLSACRIALDSAPEEPYNGYLLLADALDGEKKALIEKLAGVKEIHVVMGSPAEPEDPRDLEAARDGLLSEVPIPECIGAEDVRLRFTIPMPFLDPWLKEASVSITIVAFGVFLVIGLSVLALYLWVLQPLRRLNRAIARFGESGQWVAPSLQFREFTSLARTIGESLDRRRQAEEERARLLEELHRAQRLETIGTLASSLAHEFNNILSGILGHISLLKAQHSPGDRHYPELELIDQAAQKAVGLTGQLLALARRGKLDFQAVDLNDCVRAVLRFLEPSIDKRIQVRTQLQPTVATIRGDRNLIEQVLINLFLNARDAMPEGGELRLETREVVLDQAFCESHAGVTPGPYVCLSVADTGVGMDDETLAHVFEPFFTTKESGHGTGLGLYIAHAIVQNHGGFIDVRSKVGEGTVFDICFPASPRSAPTSSPAVVQEQRGGTILVMDDEELVRATLERMLGYLGYRVLLAKDGREGIEVFAQHRDEIDLVLIDMNMPTGGGQAFRELRRLRPDVRVLLISGFARDKAVQELLDEGALGFIAKPFTLEDLSRRVQEALAATPR
ncbi:MAG: response regulator [Chloroflexi bacterium]|nr:response regulator [Chloroflexota bacterium]